MKHLFLFLCFVSVCFQLKAQTPDEKLAIAERVIKETPEFKSFKEKNKKYEMGFDINHAPVEKITDKIISVMVSAREIVEKNNENLRYKVLDMVCFSVNIETYKAVFKKWKGAINLDKNAIIVEPIKK